MDNITWENGEVSTIEPNGPPRQAYSGACQSSVQGFVETSEHGQENLEWRDIEYIEPKFAEPGYRHIYELIFELLIFPEHWSYEGISPPNMAAKNIGLELCYHIYSTYGVLPYRIAPTKEEGLFILYASRFYDVQRSLIIEVYNDMSIAALVNDDSAKKILYSEEITDFDLDDAFHVYKK